MDNLGYESPEIGLRTAAKTPLAAAFVVDPRGNIRTLRYHGNVANGLLDVEIIPDPTKRGRPGRIGAVRLKPGAMREGWAMLRDLYESEGRMVDWETYVSWHNKVQKTGSSMQIEDKYLPDEVLRRRAFREEEIRFEMPLPQREQDILAAKAGEINTKPEPKKDDKK